MAAPVVASATGVTVPSSTGGNTLVFNKPGGLADGDVLAVAVAVACSASPTIVLPSDWTIPTNGQTTWSSSSAIKAYGATKEITSAVGEPATYTFDTSGVTGFATVGVIFRVTGADTGSPVDVAANQITTSGATGTFPSVSTTGVDELVLLAAFALYTGAPSGSQWDNVVPAGTTASGRADASSDNAYMGTAYFTQSTAGATGSKTVATPTLTAANDFQAITLAIKPPAGTAVTPTGQAATVSRGALSPATDRALTGASGSVAAGNLTPGVAPALTGGQASAGQGALGPSVAVALTGVSVTTVAGALTAGAPGSASLSGAEAALGQGQVGSQTSVALTGVAVTAQAGQVGAQSANGLTGAGVTASQGSVAPQLARDLAGQPLAATGGELTAVNPNAPGLSGQQAAAAAGQVGASVSVQLTGVALGVAAGLLEPSLGGWEPAPDEAGSWAPQAGDADAWTRQTGQTDTWT